MTNGKRWSIVLLILSLASLFLVAGFTIVVDPFFHYHGPLDGLQYPLSADNQRYLNDGIQRHFDYDAIITGTSMTECFQASQFDALFGVHSIKVPFMGGTFAELHQNIRRALRRNPEVKTVLCSLDYFHLFQSKDELWEGRPAYLYDNNPLNDLPYLLSKDVLCKHTVRVLQYTASGRTTTTFDEYCVVGKDEVPGAQALLQGFTRKTENTFDYPFTEELREQLVENLTIYTIALAKENPDVQFLYFIPPYGILAWDDLLRAGDLPRLLEAWTLASQMLTQVDNISLFSFFTDYGTITDLDNYYPDGWHYSKDVNSQILQYMYDGAYQLTAANYEAYWQEVADFYNAYPYDALFED